MFEEIAKRPKVVEVKRTKIPSQFVKIRFTINIIEIIIKVNFV